MFSGPWLSELEAVSAFRKEQRDDVTSPSWMQQSVKRCGALSLLV